MATSDEYSPTYRERDVDETLEDHEGRIYRLERVALIGIGYGLAEGGNVVQVAANFLM